MQSAEVSQFGIENIGRRVKAINDDKINCLFYSSLDSDVQKRYFVEGEKESEISISQEQDEEGNITKVTIAIAKNDDFWTHDIALVTVENPAYDLLRSSIYEHLSYNNNINITSMPVYHLDAN